MRELLTQRMEAADRMTRQFGLNRFDTSEPVPEATRKRLHEKQQIAAQRRKSNGNVDPQR